MSDLVGTWTTKWLFTAIYISWDGLPQYSNKISSRRWHSSWVHYSDVIMSSMASQITSLTIVYSPVQINENIKAPCHWPLYGEFTGEFPAQMISNAENVSIRCRHHVTQVESHLSSFSSFFLYHKQIVNLHRIWQHNCCYDKTVIWSYRYYSSKGKMY